MGDFLHVADFSRSVVLFLPALSQLGFGHLISFSQLYYPVIVTLERESRIIARNFIRDNSIKLIEMAMIAKGDTDIKTATSRTVGHLSKGAEVMKLVNNLMKAPEVATTMQEFSKEMTKTGVIEEMVNESVDSALDSEDIEEETEEEVEKVLAMIAGETLSQLPDAVRKERIKQPASSQKAEQQLDAIAVGEEDEGELDEIRARLAKVRS